MVQWTPKAEAAAPDAPCRRMGIEGIVEVVNHLRLSSDELESMAASRVGLPSLLLSSAAVQETYASVAECVGSVWARACPVSPSSWTGALPVSSL